MRRRRRVRGWLVLAIAAGLLAAVPVPEAWVERFYARGFYPWLQAVVTTLTNRSPVAVIDLVLAALVLAGLVRLLMLRRVWRQHGALGAIGEGARRLVRAAAIVVIVFLLSWGLNYRREPLAGTLEPPPPASTAILVEVIEEANRAAALLRPAVRDEDLTYAALADDLAGPMRQALRHVGRPQVFAPGRPRAPRLLSPFFARAGVTGMLNPFGLETLVHPDLVPVEHGFVLAHEWAHLAGHADEAEASAVGWLACMYAGPAAAYSANLYLIMEAGAALHGEVRQRAFAALDEGVREDLAAIAARVHAQQDPRVQRAAFRVYDEYLRANRVEDGTASYGRALSLILSPTLRSAMERHRPAAR